MIIQGSNAPIVFTFSEVMTTILDIQISLYNVDTNIELKHWTKGDVTINGKTITAPLTQAETIAFPEGKCKFELKWMDKDGKTVFAKDISNNVKARRDKTIMQGGD